MNSDLGIGLTELILILLIVLGPFDVGRIGRVAGDLGEGIKAFRQILGAKKV